MEEEGCSSVPVSRGKKRPLSFTDEFLEKKEGKRVVRKMPTSGRWWKSVERQKSSMMIYKTMQTGLSKSLEKKMKLRQKKLEMKELQAELKKMREERFEKAREKRLAKQKRKAENEFKNTQFQVMHNPAEKLKRMSKKQLRTIKKTEMDKDGNVRLVPLYGSSEKQAKKRRKKK